MGSTESATKRVTVEREEDNIKVRLSMWWKVFRIGTVRYNWPISAHASHGYTVPSHAFGRSPFNNCRTRHPNPNLNPNPNSYPNIALTINLTLTLILTVSNPNLNSNPTLTLTLRKVRKWTRAHAFSTAHCTDSEDLPM